MGAELEVGLTEAQREAAVAHLRQAVATSNLGLDVFSEAVSLVLAASTAEEVRLVMDRVAPPVRMTAPHRRLTEPVVFEIRSGRLELGSSWQLGRLTRVVNGSGRVLLDLTTAEFDDTVVDLELSTQSGTITVVVPHAVDVQFLEMSGHSGSVVNEIGQGTSMPGAPLVRIRAWTTSGRIVVRRPAPPGAPRRRWSWRRSPSATPT